jgi:hypothetical protein
MHKHAIRTLKLALVLATILGVAIPSLTIPAAAAEPATSTLPSVTSATVNKVAISEGAYSNTVSITLPKGNYVIWSILGGTNGATVNCSVLNGTYDMFDFTGLGEASFVAGVVVLSAQSTVDLSCETPESDVTMTFAQLQAQQVGTVKGTVTHQ